MKKHTYGWTRDLPDFRDHKFSVIHPETILALSALPVSVDLRPQSPPVFDQGQLGSCTANSIANAHRFAQKKQKEVDFAPSRLFIYYNERAMEGTVSSDSGAQIRDGFKSIGQQGVCPETQWPYTITKFKNKPSATCYTEATKHQAVTYMSVAQTEVAIKSCLAAGFPISFGFSVYDSF